MAKNKKEKVEQPESPEEAATTKAPVNTVAAPHAGKDQAIVYDPRGNPHRRYSLEHHGERYAELAAEYISDRPGWTVR